MFVALFFVLVVIWAVGFLAFHIAGALIHVLLLFALVSIILHLIRGRPAAV